MTVQVSAKATPREIAEDIAASRFFSGDVLKSVVEYGRRGDYELPTIGGAEVPGASCLAVWDADELGVSFCCVPLLCVDLDNYTDKTALCLKCRRWTDSLMVGGGVAMCFRCAGKLRPDKGAAKRAAKMMATGKGGPRLKAIVGGSAPSWTVFDANRLAEGERRKAAIMSALVQWDKWSDDG